MRRSTSRRGRRPPCGPASATACAACSSAAWPTPGSTRTRSGSAGSSGCTGPTTATTSSSTPAGTPASRTASPLLAAAAGYRLAVSNKPEGFTVDLLRRFGCLDRFGAVLGGDSTARKKPWPDPVLEACRRLGVAPADAWMLGDSPGDLHAALDAGLPGRVGATWGYRDRPLLEDAPHTALVDRFDAFLGLLGD
ncbi:MAG: HAD-IA family hydrolase [Planctomycetota bacterium]